MRSRATIHDEFVARFHFGERPFPVAAHELDRIEAELETKLPAAYREFMARHGKIYMPGILTEIAERDLPHPDVQNFAASEEVIENTKGYWSAGMPCDVIGIASDCMGNMIGFRRQSAPTGDAPVVFFDHDFIDVTEVADSFDTFLAWYLDHLQGG